MKCALKPWFDQAHHEPRIALILSARRSRKAKMGVSKDVERKQLHYLLATLAILTTTTYAATNSTMAQQGLQKQELHVQLPNGTKIDIHNQQATGGHVVNPVMAITPPTLPSADNTFVLARLRALMPSLSRTAVVSISACLALRCWVAYHAWYVGHPSRSYAWCTGALAQTAHSGAPLTLPSLVKTFLGNRYTGITLTAAIRLCMEDLAREEVVVRRLARYYGIAHTARSLLAFPVVQRCAGYIIPWSPEGQELVQWAQAAIICTRTCLQELLSNVGSSPEGTFETQADAGH